MASAKDERDSSGWSATSYNTTASFVYSPAFTAPVLELLAVQPGERVLDLGCGSGEVTLDIARRVGAQGSVVGVDASESMITKARANGVAHAFVCDAQELRFPADFTGPAPGTYDAVFSNAAFHWCKRSPRGVLDGAHRVLKPGGRLVGEMGGFMNCIGVRSALHYAVRRRGYNPEELDPWFFPSVEDYEILLKSASLRPTHLSLTPRVTPLDTEGLAGWLRLFARHSFLECMSDEEADAVIAEVEELCAPDTRDRSGRWAMMYMRLRFVAIAE